MHTYFSDSQYCMCVSLRLMNSFNCRYSKTSPQLPVFLFFTMGFPTLVTLVHCSEVLRSWISELTEADREKLSLWGIPPRLLKGADVEVSRHLLCTTARFWKPTHYVFRFSRVELTPTLEEVRRICSFSKFMGPAVFMRRSSYVTLLK